MSKLLLDKPPLLVIPDLAVLIGLHESIVLQQIHYWIELNREADKNFEAGFYWTYNSYHDWQKQFKFWNVVTIKRLIGKLETIGLIISDNFNRMKFDRTKWYRIDYERLESFTKSPKYQTDLKESIKLSKTLIDTETIPEIREYPEIPEEQGEIMRAAYSVAGRLKADRRKLEEAQKDKANLDG